MKKAYIDTLRAFSVCLIFLYHFNRYIEQFNFSIPLFYGYRNGNWGNVGVFLFFMISGNVLYYKYGENINYKTYFKNRFFKIFPLFWICYCFAFLFYFWQLKTFPDIPSYKFIYTILGMDGFLAYKTETFYLLGEWFLGSIIIVYLLFPLIRICVNKNIHVTLGVLLLLTSFIYHNNFWGLFQIAIGNNIIVALFYFVFGIWLEEIILSCPKNIHFIIVCIFSILSLFILFIKLPVNQYICYLAITASIYVLAMDITKYLRCNKVINNLVEILSKNSYTIFLIHHIIIQNITRHFTGNAYSLKGILCILTICVLVTYICVWIINHAPLPRTNRQ